MIARTGSADETRALGASLAEVLGPCDLIVLCGDLGAGKTTLTQGIASALGVADQVTSPTFTLVRRYEGRVPLHHLDVYRVASTEVVDLGLPELMDDDAVVVVEWGDTISSELGADRLEIRLGYGAGDDDRLLELEFMGPSWMARAHRLSTLLSPWVVEP